MHVKIDGLRYEVNGRVIINNLSVDISEGCKYLLDWPSGTGKTSLLRILFGFAVPTSGEIFFDGKVAKKSDFRNIRKSISYINQHADLHSGIVKEALGEVFSYPANARIENPMQQLTEMLPQLNLQPEIFTKLSEDLSGGERQRLLFLICKVLDKPLWLFDEITSGLDIKNKQTVVDMVAKSKQTAIISSHDTVWRENPNFISIKLS